MTRPILPVALVVMLCAACSDSPGKKGLAAALSMTAPTPTAPGAAATPAPAPAPALTGITLSRATVELVVGSSETLSVTAQYSDGSSSRVAATWTSSNQNIASPDAFGVIRAVAKGTATVTATAGSASASATVTVTDPR